jgi:hypothetical protein
MEDIPKKHKTREGYLKDGFIVEEPVSVSTTSKKLKQLKGKSKKNILPPTLVSASAASACETQHDEVELEEEPYITDDDDNDSDSC